MAGAGSSTLSWTIVGFARRFAVIWVPLMVLLLTVGPFSTLSIILVTAAAFVGAAAWTAYERRRRAVPTA